MTTSAGVLILRRSPAPNGPHPTERRVRTRSAAVCRATTSSERSNCRGARAGATARCPRPVGAANGSTGRSAQTASRNGSRRLTSSALRRALASSSTNVGGPVAESSASTAAARLLQVSRRAATSTAPFPERGWTCVASPGPLCHASVGQYRRRIRWQDWPIDIPQGDPRACSHLGPALVAIDEGLLATSLAREAAPGPRRAVETSSWRDARSTSGRRRQEPGPGLCEPHHDGLVLVAATSADTFVMASRWWSV